VAGAVRNALTAYAGSDWVLDGLVVLVLGRLALAAAGRRSLDPIWDALGLAAVAYAAAFVKLGLTREYYQAPADFMATLYVARLAYAGLLAQPSRAAILAVGVAAWVFQYDLRDAAHRLLIRKQYVQGNVQLAAFLRRYAEANGGGLQLYFPGVGGFEVMELSAFLQFKGFNAAPRGAASAGPSFVVKTAHRFPGDRGLPTEAVRCEFAPSPESGDLVVYLAGREFPPRALDSSSGAGAELFHYRPADTGVEHVLRLLARSDAFGDRSPDVRVFDRSRASIATLGSASRSSPPVMEGSGRFRPIP
jgi:hypothetical protein